MYRKRNAKKPKTEIRKNKVNGKKLYHRVGGNIRTKKKKFKNLIPLTQLRPTVRSINTSTNK